MAIPVFTDLVRYVSTKITGANWNTNWQKAVNWLSDGTADVTFNTVTTNSDVTVGGDATVTGTVTAASFSGDGSAITGLDTYRKNLIVNGNTTIKNNADYTLVKDTYGESVDKFEGMATGTAVSAGTLTQTTTANTGGRSGYGILFNNVTITGTGIIYLRHRMYNKTAVNFKDAVGSFSFRTWHNIGSSVVYTIYARKANALNDFSAVTEITNDGGVSVSTSTATQRTFENISFGDCSNGLEIEIKVECGAITTKNIEFSELQLELGSTVTNFEFRTLEEELSYTNLDQNNNFSNSGSITSGARISDKTGLLMPVGAILPYVAASAPSGFLLCNGSAVSRTTYADLFAIIGITHGQGDGATTFNVPDYQGRFLRGWDNSAGRDPDAATRTAMATGGATGDNIGSVQTEQFKSHTHNTSTDGTHVHDLRVEDSSGAAVDPVTFREAWGSTTRSGDVVSTNSAHDHTITSSGGNETRPINAYVNYIIKY